MMKKSISILFCVLFSVGCSSLVTSQRVEIPGLEEIDDINRSITFEGYNMLPDNMVSLAVVNHSNHPIWFPADWRIVLLINDNNGQWQTIENQLTYSGITIVYPFTQGDLGMVVVKPLTNGVSTAIRVVIIGNFYLYNQPAEDRLVAAYIDINLEP